PNWNFSVKASSGDSENVLNVSLYMGTTWPPIFKCEAPTCINQTPAECLNCINSTKYWYRNFTANDIGNWYYQFKMDGAETSQVLYVTVEKDDANISYVEGNNSIAKYSPAQSAKFVVRVYDLDAQTYNLNPAATVTFRIKYNGLYDKIIGTNKTNSSGYAEFYFTPDCSFSSGDQYWYAEIASDEPYYKPYTTSYFNISIDTSGCKPQIKIGEIKQPKETFQYRNFTIGVTVGTLGPSGTVANDVYVNLTLPTGWQADSTTKYVGNVSVGELKTIWFNIYPTTYSSNQIKIFVNSSNAENDSLTINVFTYKFMSETSSQETLPYLLNSNEAKEFNFVCEAGSYRIANLSISTYSSSLQDEKIRIEVYNGTDWIDVSHSLYFTSPSSLFIPILEKQIQPSETGYCKIRITNIGSNPVNISSLKLSAYYNETVLIQDIDTNVNGISVKGLEKTDRYLNVSVILSNSFNQQISGTLYLNITDAYGNVVYSSSLSLILDQKSSYIANFTNIDTQAWNEGNYSIIATFVYNSNISTRVELLTIKDVTVNAKGSNWMCNYTSEPFIVEIYHPFNEEIDYNVTLSVPTGWTFTPSYQVVKAITPGKYYAQFTLTSSNSASELANIQAIVNYNHITQKTKTATFQIQESNSMAILEVIRETPQFVSPDKVFESRLVVHNKGCAKASGATIIETLESGWTPANPSIKTNVYGSSVQLLSSSVDLINNLVIWNLGDIDVNEYAVLTYQVKAPNTYSKTGSFKFNVSWDGKSFEEENPFTVSTASYNQESHLSFDIEAIQQDEYPWPEVRSSQINRAYNYSLKVTNIGDTTASGWTVYLSIPEECEVLNVYNGGTFNPSTRKISWSLPSLSVYSSAYLNFTLNCSLEGKKVLVAEGILDTTSESYFVNDTSISCSGNSCSLTYPFVFTKPINARYEKMKEIAFLINYSFGDENLTIAEAKVSIADDLLNKRIFWQNYSHSLALSKVWSNYSIDNNDSTNFVNSLRNIFIDAYADSSTNPYSNVSIEKIAYVWSTGKLFNETQNLFIKSKIYKYSPLLTNATLYINDQVRNVGGWGENYKFGVYVRDRFGRDVIVYAWHRMGSNEYSLIGSQVCYNCSQWTQLNFSFKYDGSAIGTWSFKFNATNADGPSEILGYDYTIEKDDISVFGIQPILNATVNRSMPFDFTMFVFDTDNQTYPYYLQLGQVDEGKARIFISKYGSNETFDTSSSLSANSTGYVVRMMQNTSDSWCKVSDYYLGQNYWKGGVFGASTYKDNVTPIIPFWLMGDLSNSYMLYPNGSINYTRGQVVEFDGVIKDDCGLVKTDSASFGVEYRISHGSTVYTIVAPLTYTTWTIPQDAPLGWYNVTMIAFAEGSEAGKYWNGTYFKENAFFVASNIKLDNPQVSPYPKGSWQINPFNFSIYVTSEDGEPVYTYLWLKRENSNWQIENSSICVNCNNYQFFTQKSFSCSDIGSWYAKFNATSPTTFENETQVIAFNITKTPISIDYSSGNNSVVNRSDSVIGNTVNLTVRIKNLVFGNYTTEISTDEVYGYVTTDDVNWKQEIVYSNETHYFINFNPDCSYSVGIRKWKVNVSSACYESNSSQEFYVTIVGSLSNSIISPTGDTNYTAGEKIYLIGEVYDDCGNPISDASIRFKLTSGSKEYYCPSSGYITNTSNTYVCEFDTTGKSGGWYNVSMESSKQYYLNASSFKQNAFFLITPVELINPKVEYPNDGSWGEIHNFSVIVNHYASVNVCLLESTSSDGPWSVTDCKFIENPSYTLVNFTRDYTCSDYQQAAIRYFMFNASEPNVL
ncbi:MAG: DUF11 domain-containing protein, partial [Sulfurihydrogenibium sp.]|nr:DUF11 domain-containing protein [Sulfurihydrogenibium sp.]